MITGGTVNNAKSLAAVVPSKSPAQAREHAAALVNRIQNTNSQKLREIAATQLIELFLTNPEASVTSESLGVIAQAVKQRRISRDLRTTAVTSIASTINEQRAPISVRSDAVFILGQILSDRPRFANETLVLSELATACRDRNQSLANTADMVVMSLISSHSNLLMPVLQRELKQAEGEAVERIEVTLSLMRDKRKKEVPKRAVRRGPAGIESANRRCRTSRRRRPIKVQVPRNIVGVARNRVRKVA